MRSAFAFVLFVATVGSVDALEIPRYPVDDICKRFADYATGNAVTVRKHDEIAKSCVLAQQEAYDRLKREWRVIAPDDQASCLNLTQSANNYRSLEACAGSMAAQRTDEQRAKVGGPLKY